MITVGGFLAKRRRRVSPPRIVTSSSLTIFRTCWAGVQRLVDVGAEGALLDVLDERTDDGQRHVRFEERDPDLARGGVDVRLGEPSLAAQVLESG
jgi:hypothetical protein